MNEIIENTLKIEGGYVNDPDDRGAETYRGISRRFHPEWKGWPIIDRYKQAQHFDPKLLDGNDELQRMVVVFYEEEYLSPFMELDDASIRAELFDTAVNMGVGTASEMLQSALNLMNRNGQTFDDLVVDGDIGSKTLEAYERSDKAILLKVLNGLQFMRYVEIVETDPRQEKFFNGWMRRV